MRIALPIVMVLAASSVAAAPRTFEITATTTTWKKSAKVKVTMTYRNTKSYPVTITTYGCAWTMHFARVDRELAWEERECGKDYRPASVELKPNETKTWTIDMFPIKSARVGAHTLKLTFAPDGAPAAYPSNEIAITVEP